jgi:hypothetical protein
MSDLHTELTKIAGAARAPSPSTVDADLSRGRRALRRRRVARIATGSGLAVAAVLAAALTLPGALRGGHSTSVASGRGQTQVVTRLVAYTGKQPDGVTLDQVPAGWEVQGSDKYGLTLAPRNAADKDPRNFDGKIAIFLQKDVPDVTKKNVLVGGQPAVLATMKGGPSSRTLFVKQPSGAYLAMQVWGGLGWGESQIVEFATGVHVNDGAGFSVG